MTTREQISDWFDRGVEQGAAYMAVVCDMFDHGDYPCYEYNTEAMWERYDHPGEMQKVMEVYDLRQDRDEQLRKPRCFSLPDRDNVTARMEPGYYYRRHPQGVDQIVMCNGDELFIPKWEKWMQSSEASRLGIEFHRLLSDDEDF